MRCPPSSILVAVLVTVCGCADRSGLEPKYDYYYPTSRKYAAEPVYSRVTYSHLPAPIPLRNQENVPYLPVVISFEMPDSNLREAIEALAQTMGYRWEFSKGLKARPVSLKMVGRVDEILREISRQAGVVSEIDYKERLIRVGEFAQSSANETSETSVIKPSLTQSAPDCSECNKGDAINEKLPVKRLKVIPKVVAKTNKSQAQNCACNWR